MRELLLVHGHVALLILLLAAALTGAFTEKVLGALLSARRWRERTRPRGLTRAWRVEVGAVGRFSGVLRVEGEPAECFEGRPCAVATAAARAKRGADFACASTRASRLLIEVDGRRIALIGEVEVIAPGPTSTAATRPPSINERIVAHAGVDGAWWFDSLPTELRRVEDGERVEVAGRVVRQADDAGAYRIAASALTIEGEAGRLLLRPLRATRNKPPWRGACAAAVAALFLTGSFAEAGAPSPELVSPLHRTDALAAISDPAVDRLTPVQREARLILLDENDHAGRAATLRAMTRLGDALAEASLGTDVASAREALITRLRMPLAPTVVDAWLTLASRVDAACQKTGRCETRERTLELTETPARWGTAVPNRNLLGVLFSDGTAHARAELTLVMGRGLLAQGVKGSVAHQLRARWLLEYAAILIQLGDSGRALESLDAVDRSVEELGATPGRPLGRDARGLREVLQLRASFRTDELRCTGCRDPSWCQSGLRNDDTCVLRQRRRRGGWSELPMGFVLGLRTAEASGQILSGGVDGWSANRMEYARRFVPHLGLAAHTALVVRLTNRHECEVTATVAGVVRASSIARTLTVLGSEEEALRVELCAERGRAELLGGV